MTLPLELANWCTCGHTRDQHSITAPQCDVPLCSCFWFREDKTEGVEAPPNARIELALRNILTAADSKSNVLTISFRERSAPAVQICSHYDDKELGAGGSLTEALANAAARLHAQSMAKLSGLEQQRDAEAKVCSAMLELASTINVAPAPAEKLVQQVSSIEALKAIPAGQLVVDMLVEVTNTGHIFKLEGGLANVCWVRQS